MRKIVAAIVLGSMFSSSLLFAKVKPITLTTKSYKEIVSIGKNGKKTIKLVEAKKVVPGDYVIYKNSIKNNTNKAVKDMVLNNAIPEHTEYVANSAKCSGDCEILFSVDGGKSFAKADKLMVKIGNKKRLASPKEYTNVRWVLTSALDANSVTDVSFKTKLQ